MAIEHFRVITFLVYLASWLALAVAAVLGAMPRLRRSEAHAGMSGPEMGGLALQCVAALPITLSLGDGPLRPAAWEMVGAIALAPVAAGMFWWAQRSAPKEAGAGTLVTGGAYSMVRHPMYLAFFAMLLATGLLASGGLRMGAAVALYLAGTELRVAVEEAELAERLPEEYAQYRRLVRWRYLWGLR